MSCTGFLAACRSSLGSYGSQVLQSKGRSLRHLRSGSATRGDGRRGFSNKGRLVTLIHLRNESRTAAALSSHRPSTGSLGPLLLSLGGVNKVSGRLAASQRSLLLGVLLNATTVVPERQEAQTLL